MSQRDAAKSLSAFHMGTLLQVFLFFPRCCSTVPAILRQRRLRRCGLFSQSFWQCSLTVQQSQAVHSPHWHTHIHTLTGFDKRGSFSHEDNPFIQCSRLFLDKTSERAKKEWMNECYESKCRTLQAKSSNRAASVLFMQHTNHLIMSGSNQSSWGQCLSTMRSGSHTKQ